MRTKPTLKAVDREKKIKSRAEINEIETNKQKIQRINEMKSWLLEKINEFVAKLATGVGVGGEDPNQ